MRLDPGMDATASSLVTTFDYVWGRLTGRRAMHRFPQTALMLARQKPLRVTRRWNFRSRPWVAKIPGAVLHEMPGGHAPWLDDPAACAQPVTNCLRARGVLSVERAVKPGQVAKRNPGGRLTGALGDQLAKRGLSWDCCAR
jgi:hypothetical protein